MQTNPSCQARPWDSIARSIRPVAFACPATASGWSSSRRSKSPRRADGSVDVTATAQMLNDKVESWVREYPGQWLWYHDRWHIKRTI
ncbi:hypothetical protein [Sinorhizobium meliloti]|uniref:LpxL/LpxP family acyltransferase n=1 Tax=Rhizobium meliloti TaxID=382 RepID=UPI00398CC80F